MNKIVRDRTLWPRLVVDNTADAEKSNTSGQKAQAPTSELAQLLEETDSRTRFLQGDLTFFREWLPSFEKVISVTANDSAVMSEIGLYQAPMELGEPLEFDNIGIALRLLPEDLQQTVAVEANPAVRVSPSIQVFDAQGKAAHKCFLASQSDDLAFDILMHGPVEGAPMQQGRPVDVSEPEKGEAPTSPITPDALSVVENLDACVPQGGIRRHAQLPDLHEDLAWQVDRQVVPHFLAYIYQLRLPLMIAVPSTACLQLKAGRLDAVIQHDVFMELSIGANRTYFDPADISEYWVVKSSESLSLECYSKAGECVVVFTQHLLRNPRFNESWMKILESLPKTRRRTRHRADEGHV